MFNIFANVIKTATRENSWGGSRETHPITRQNSLLRHEDEQRRELQRQLQRVKNFSNW